MSVADEMTVEAGEVQPRGGHAGERSRLAAAAVVLGLVSPLAVPVAAVTLVRLMGQVRRGWREVAWVTGPLTVAVAVLLFLAGVPGLAGWLLWVSLTGVPLGLAAGAGSVGLLERWAAGAEWHYAERRRRAVAATRKHVHVARLARPELVDRHPAPVLGVFHDGDLEPWRQGNYVVPPSAKVPAQGVIGGSGTGKTVTVERFTWLWAAERTRVIFADFKGSDDELPPRVIAAYLDARPDATCQVWPTQPLDMWQGTGTDVANRLLMVQNFSEPFYQQAAETAVRLAVNLPGEPPVRDSAEFLRRLNLDVLQRAYENTPQEPDVAALRMPQVMEGVRLRYAGFFAALGDRFDGEASWGDADLSVLTIPTLAQPSDAMAAAKMILADFGAYCMVRKPRNERVVIVVDEFSAVTGAAAQVIDLAERVRDANGMVVVCVQSFEGLGRDQGERMRMLEALEAGGIVIHRCSNPAEVLKMAGTRWETEKSWHLNSVGHTGAGGVKMNRTLSVDPDDIRRLQTGWAYVLTRGRWLEMSVIETRIGVAARAQARDLIEQAQDAMAEMNERAQLALARQQAEARAVAARRAEQAAAQAAADVQATADRDTRPGRAPARRPRAPRASSNGASNGSANGQQALLDVPPPDGPDSEEG